MDTFQAGFSTMGGSADALSYPRAEEQHPIDDPDHVEEAIAYAAEALAAAEKLEGLDYAEADATSSKFLDVAVECYIERFEIPSFALESEDDDDKPKAGRLKKVILYLYAIVERVFKTLFDFFGMHKATARKLIPVIKSYIGHADSISASVASQLVIKDRSLMNALHLDGAAPSKPHELYRTIAHNFQVQQKFSAVSETAKLVSAAKEKNYGRVMQEARALHEQLKAGIEEDMEPVDPGTQSAIFSEKKAPGNSYYATEAMFGQNHLVGVISDEVRDNGTFTFHCGIRRDSEVALRVNFFPLLSPDEIRAICRTSLTVCEDVIRFARDEELLKSVLRDASFARTKEPDQSSVVALRNITALGQNSYIVHLRYTVRIMQSLLRWCAQSIAKYEEVKK
jgi:hypothetical protein